MNWTIGREQIKSPNQIWALQTMYIKRQYQDKRQRLIKCIK